MYGRTSRGSKVNEMFINTASTLTLPVANNLSSDTYLSYLITQQEDQEHFSTSESRYSVYKLSVDYACLDRFDWLKPSYRNQRVETEINPFKTRSNRSLGECVRYVC